MFVGHVRTSVVVAFALVAVGCGGLKDAAERKRAQEDLKELGLAYSNYQDMKGKPPASLDELVGASKGLGNSLPAGIGRLNVPWGAGFGSMYRGGAATEAVFASGRASGGIVPVLMADGSVKTMKQKDFESAKKVTR
jgi:hypothetical protein